MIIITGKSGSGKTTLSNYLEEHYGYSIPYNYTTRKPRDYDENDYSEYRFLSKEHFGYLSNTGQLLNETEFDGNRYGIDKRTLNLDKVVFVVDESGRMGLSDKIPNVTTVWVETPNFERRKRLFKRGLRDEDLEERMYGVSENMFPTKSCIIIDGTKPVKEEVKRLISLIEEGKGIE